MYDARGKSKGAAAEFWTPRNKKQARETFLAFAILVERVKSGLGETNFRFSGLDMYVYAQTAMTPADRPRHY